MKRILSFILTFAMMLSVIGSVVINPQTAYARKGVDVNGNPVDNSNIYQPTDDPVYYYQPPVDENGNHDYFGYPMYGDPQDIPDEEFFGKWDETTNRWVFEPYFRYSEYPDMAKVEEAAKIGDYETAKEELQNYYVPMVYRAGPMGSFDAKAPEYLEALSRNVFSYSYIGMTSNGPFDIYAGDWSKTEFDVLDIVNSAKSEMYTDLSLMLASGDKFWTTAQIYSKDAADPSVRPVLQMIVNGVATERYPSMDNMVVAGANRDINYGYDEIIEIQEHGTYDDVGEPNGSYDKDTKRAFICFDISDITPNDKITLAKVTLTARSVITDETRERFADENGNPYSGDARDKIMWSMWYRISSWEEGDLTWGTDAIGDKYFFSCNDMNAWDYITSNGTGVKGKVCGYHRGNYQKGLRTGYTNYKDERYAYNLIRQEMAMINSIGLEPKVMNQLDMAEYSRNLAGSCYGLIDSKYMTPEIFTTFLKFIWQMTEQQVNHFYGTKDNNWATYSTAAVYQALSLFQEFEKHDYWFQRTIDENNRCLAGQTLEDGHCVEASQGYVSTILTTFNSPLAVTRNTGHAIPYSEEIYQNIHDIVKTGLYTSGGPGYQGFNIADSGDIGESRTSLYKTWYQNLFSDDEELLYVISNGTSGKLPENPTTHYPVALRTFMRSGWDGDKDLQMSFINSSDSRLSHEHSDCLSIAMYAYGSYLLSDQGYGSDQTGDGGRVWTYNRSPVQHNLVTVNDVYDYLNDGVCAYTTLVPDSTWEKDFETNKSYDFVEYVCDGYTTAQTMQRSVTFLKDQKFWIVSDYAVPKNPEEENLFAQHWHMYPGANITHDDEYVLRSNFDGPNVLVVPMEDEEIDEVLYQDSLFGGQGGQKVVKKKAVLTKSKTGDAKFTTLIIPVNIGENFEVTSKVLENKNENIDDDLLNMAYFNITETNKNSSSYYYYYHINDASKKPVDGVKVANYITDATTMVMQVNERGELISLFVTDASYIKDEDRNGEYLFYSDEATTVSFTRRGQFVNVVSSLITEPEDLKNIEIYMPSAKAARLDGEDVRVSVEDGVISFEGSYGSSNISSGSGGSGGGGSSGGGGGAPVKPPVVDDENEEDNKDNVNDDNKEENIENNPVVKPVTPSYSDVKENDWYFEYVEELTEKGVVSGGGEGKFNPTDNVTREQFLKMLIEAAEIETDEAENTFADVLDAWYKPYVLKAKSFGIVNGISDTEFGIGSNITRQDMAVMITRTIEKLGIEINAEDVDVFEDNEKVSGYAKDAVTFMKSIGLIEGYNNEYRPLDNLTRAEAAKVISELLKLL